MERRTILAAIGVGVAGLGAGGFLILPRGTRPLTITAARDALAPLRGRPIRHSGGWTPAQVFDHLAQSIEFSMRGFPQAKSALFQSTVGALAFRAFEARGAMKHSLTEPIPGAPALASGNPNAAFDRLTRALDDFEGFPGPLRPHFA